MVLPLYDDNPFKWPYRPVVTWWLIGINLFVFLVEFSATDADVFATSYGVVPAALFGDVRVPGGLSPTLTLLTYQFLHADFMHIFGNMIFLWVFGDDIE